MCEFLHSLYEVLANLYQQRDDDDALSRYQLANVVISFLRCLVEKGESLIVIAFLQKVIEKMQNEESTVIAPLAKVVNYLLLYLVYEVRHLMNKKMLLPIHISKLNESISPHVSAKDLKR